MNLSSIPSVAAVTAVAAVFAITIAAGPLGAGEGAEVRIDAGKLQLVADGKLRLDYRLGGPGSFKSYVAALHLPGGINPLRDSPHDHIHHHALMLAWNVNGVEFWGVEDKNCGRQVHISFADLEGPREDGRTSFSERLEWKGPASPDAPAAIPFAGKTLLLEERRIALRPARPGEPQLLDWTSTFRVPAGLGRVALSGREYHGLGVRFLVPMDKGGRFRNADGGAGVEGTNKKRSRWCAYSAAVESGEKVTVAMFDDPKNPRSPADWFTMDSGFAYMTLTVGLDEAEMDLPEGKDLKVHYGVALFQGDAEAGAIEAAHKAWLEGKQ